MGKRQEAEAAPELSGRLRPVACRQRRCDMDHTVVRNVWVHAERIVRGEWANEKGRLGEGQRD